MAGNIPPWPLLLLLVTVAAAAAVDDATALLKFKASLGNATALGSWAAGTAPCPLDTRRKWAGVLCDKQTLWGLQLEGMGLTGIVDVPALSGLRDLRSISVAGNKFDGPMPNVGALGWLKSVYLSNNAFSGEIPADAFAAMGSLKKLHLADNRFSGSIPASLASAPKLLELKLEGNQFSGQIPNFQQPELKSVDFSNNELDGPIPAAFSKMDRAFFSGNKGLCGAPLDNSCESPKKMSMALVAVLVVVGVGIAAAAAGGILLVLRRKVESDEEDMTPATQEKAAAAEDVQGSGSAKYGGGGEKKEKTMEQGRLVFVTAERERFELQDLLRASAEVLRSGSFGSSYKAVLMSGPALVVKRFREMNGVGREDFQEHMTKLGRLKHPNLLPLVAFYYRKEEKLLITDYVDNASLVQSLHGNKSPERPALDWPTRLQIIKGVARGLHYLYTELPTLAAPHGHLKSSNVLLGRDYQPLLTDYALLPVISRDAKHLLVALQSPEYLQYGQVTKKSDVWSLGILILEILTGKFPANFLPNGSGGGEAADLAGWVNSVVREEWTGEVFDKDMGGTKNGEGEMLKLLQIGMGCCEEDPEKRWEMGEALAKIEQLKEIEYEDSSFASEGDFYSRASTEDDFSFSRTH